MIEIKKDVKVVVYREEELCHMRPKIPPEPGVDWLTPLIEKEHAEWVLFKSLVDWMTDQRIYIFTRHRLDIRQDLIYDMNGKSVIVERIVE